MSLIFSCLAPYGKKAFRFATSPALSPFKSLSTSKLLGSLVYLNSSTYLCTFINSDIWVRKYVVIFLRYLDISKELYLGGF